MANTDSNDSKVYIVIRNYNSGNGYYVDQVIIYDLTTYTSRIFTLWLSNYSKYKGVAFNREAITSNPDNTIFFHSGFDANGYQMIWKTTLDAAYNMHNKLFVYSQSADYIAIHSLDYAYNSAWTYGYLVAGCGNMDTFTSHWNNNTYELYVFIASD
jgi:hypothetical protein